MCSMSDSRRLSNLFPVVGRPHAAEPVGDLGLQVMGVPRRPGPTIGSQVLSSVSRGGGSLTEWPIRLLVPGIAGWHLRCLPIAGLLQPHQTGAGGRERLR